MTIKKASSRNTDQRVKHISSNSADKWKASMKSRKTNSPTTVGYHSVEDPMETTSQPIGLDPMEVVSNWVISKMDCSPPSSPMKGVISTNRNTPDKRRSLSF